MMSKRLPYLFVELGEKLVVKDRDAGQAAHKVNPGVVPGDHDPKLQKDFEQAGCDA